MRLLNDQDIFYLDFEVLDCTKLLKPTDQIINLIFLNTGQILLLMVKYLKNDFRLFC